MSGIEKIISGGQTGVDRAALDFALANYIPHGGWCPAGRKAEDGPIAPCYELRETPSADYAQRTEWNVRDSDGTAVFTMAQELTGGSKATATYARMHRKPLLHIAASSAGNRAPTLLRQFIREHGVRVLNVAGPRASEAPDVAEFVRATLARALAKHLES